MLFDVNTAYGVINDNHKSPIRASSHVQRNALIVRYVVFCFPYINSHMLMIITLCYVIVIFQVDQNSIYIYFGAQQMPSDTKL